ncbi:hypothetical protein ACI3EY_16585 [Ornithinimicrobium sp. LYQ92]|uniref:hypothetical protein n=1 Tax=Serinicoccus sp. LYQ92 TaxID=3378798 RepID=UPI003854DA12
MKNTAIAFTAALLLAGCSGGPSEGDRVACETVIDADNAVARMVDDDNRDREQLISLMRGMPDRITEAQSVAEAPELQIALSRLHKMSDFDQQQAEQDIGVAYITLMGQLEDACQEAGVTVSLDA